MHIIFEYDNKKLELPVNPESVKVTKPSQSQKVEVIGIGEVSVPQKRKLASVNISSFFWKDLFAPGINRHAMLIGGKIVDGALNKFAKDIVYNDLVNKGYDPEEVKKSLDNQKDVSFTNRFGSVSDRFKVLNEYVKWFEEWQLSRKPARWTIVVPPGEPPQCFDFYVTCESFDYEVKAGEEEDYYYNLELLEWRDYGAKVLTPETQKDGKVKYTQQPEVRLSTKAEIKSEIKANPKDSIWSMSKQYCNNNWKDLVKEDVNKEMLSNSPQNINGMMVKIPKKYINGIK